jgi:hypothetical protein
MTTIRDFIYVDVERLQSLYSQVFEGVVDSIVHTEVSEAESADAQRGGRRFSGSTVEQRVAEASFKTESRMLFDHMYNLLEQRLSSAILEPGGLSRENYVEILEHAFMFKVRGTAVVWDYERIDAIFQRYNAIRGALNYMSRFAELETAREELRARIAAETDRNQRNQLQRELDRLGRRAAQGDEPFDETFLENLSLVTNMFYPDRLEVAVHPADGPDDVVFRGILDKRWLRVSTEFVRALYGGYPAQNWTIVGQFTFIPTSQNSVPNMDSSQGEDTGENDASQALTEEQGKMRDAYRNIVTAYHEIEKTFTDSEELIEIIVWPLAIYRETTLPDTVERSMPEPQDS